MATTDIVGMVEIAQRLGVSRATVAKWRNRHGDFPPPSATVSGTPIWGWPVIERWYRTRKAGPPAPGASPVGLSDGSATTAAGGPVERQEAPARRTRSQPQPPVGRHLHSVRDVEPRPKQGKK